MKKLCIYLLIMVFSATSTIPAFAETLQEKQDNIKAEMQQHKDTMDAADLKLGEISEKIHAMQDQVDKAHAEYTEAKEGYEEATAAIEQNKEDLAKNEEEMNEHLTKLKKRVRDIYMHGRISYVDILFGAQNFSDFLMRVDVIKRILHYDYDLLQAVLKARAAMISNKVKLEENMAKAEKFYDEASAKKEEVDNKQEELNSLMEQIANDRDMAKAAYDELEAASRNIERMIQQRGSTAVAGSGQFIWPVYGPITSPYGSRIHPIYGYTIFHSGIDIGADYGDPIQAADAGTISYAGWVSGYGNTVIIDHGGGVSTLYGHNQSLAVSTGENVAQGQIIAYAGSTGNSTGPHSHFEVRINGQTANPMDYLP